MTATASPRTAAIATSDPRATDAGASVLQAGGNCVDAAIAAALALFVVEPHHCGAGGDAFLLAQLPGWDRPRALDGAGEVPAGLDADQLACDGLRAIPHFGAQSVTVPGAPALVEHAAREWGTWKAARLAAPAIALACDGFDVRPTLARACAAAVARLQADEFLAATYLVDGAPLAPGARVTNPALGELLDELGRASAETVYRGAVADAIATVVGERGGYLARADLAAHRTLPVDPIATDFAGATVWQLPSPTQGPAVIGALDRLAADTADWQVVADAIRDGLADVGVDLVGAPWRRRQGGTSHIAVVDADGGVASFITSVFAPFGSGVGVRALGGALQNRAAGFLLLDVPPTPGKPPHTIIPGLVTRDGIAETALGVAGGLMQAQGQVQLLVRLLGRGESPVTAVDAPRLRVVEGGLLALEPGHPLAEHAPGATERSPGDGGFGCAQIATVLGGVAAAADYRRDGAARVVAVNHDPDPE